MKNITKFISNRITKNKCIIIFENTLVKQICYRLFSIKKNIKIYSYLFFHLIYLNYLKSKFVKTSTFIKICQQQFGF